MMRCISFIKKRRCPENFAKSFRIFMKYFKFLIKHVWKSASVYTSSIFVYKLEWLSERPLSSWSVYHSYRIRKRILILLPYWKASRYLTLYQKCSLKKLFLKICNIHRKTPVLESLIHEVPGIQSYKFTKERPQYRCFPVNIAIFLKISILKNICQRLLLLYEQINVFIFHCYWKSSKKFLENIFSMLWTFSKKKARSRKFQREWNLSKRFSWVFWEIFRIVVRLENSTNLLHSWPFEYFFTSWLEYLDKKVVLVCMRNMIQILYFKGRS